MGICVSKEKIKPSAEIAVVITKKVPKLFNLNKNSLFRKRRSQKKSMTVPIFENLELLK